MLLCTVRNCHLPLQRLDRTLACRKGHSFDIARSGYINLLQPQDRRSAEPGDATAAVAARRRLHDLGITAPLLSAIGNLSRLSTEDEVLDVGCGEGFYLSGAGHGHGVDISVPAIESAARRYPDSEWVVANADRFVPWSDQSFTLVQSITGRMNPGEFRRIIRDDGRLLIAVAAPDDLIEIRGQSRNRVERTIAEFSGHFTLSAQSRVTTSADLEKSAIEDVLLAIYRPMQQREAAAMTVTFSLDLLLFQPR